MRRDSDDDDILHGSGSLTSRLVALNLEAQLTDAQCVQLATVIDDGSGALQLECRSQGLHLTQGQKVESLDSQAANYVGVNMTLDSTPKEVPGASLPWHCFELDPTFAA